MMVVLELQLLIPPPLLIPELPVKLQLMIRGLECQFKMPPPTWAWLPTRRQFLIIGAEVSFLIPPPMYSTIPEPLAGSSALPPVIVKPSSMAVLFTVLL